MEIIQDTAGHGRAAAKQPLVSVVMPAYNAEKHLAEAVGSVLSQTYKNWELLILDDCSSDRTGEIAAAFAAADDRISLQRVPKNIGVAGTRNLGFDRAQGDWIALLDSDDVWHSEKLERQLSLAEQSGADILYCSYALINEQGAHLSDFIVPGTTSYREMLKENALGCSTVLLSRAVVSAHRFSTDHYHEDYAFWLTLLKAGYRAAACREILVDYRVVPGSRSSDKLRSAKNRWLIYRRAERLPLPRAACAFAAYAWRGFRKHKRV